jgi:thymidylate synthase (FAD)
MLADGATPQMARSVLPNSLKTEIIVTASPHDWDHFFTLRCDPAAQPDMKEVADMTKFIFEETQE